MSFENLSATWADQPLTDPVLAADAVDLMVSLGDRRRGTLTVLICDPDARYLATVLVGLPESAAADLRRPQSQLQPPADAQPPSPAELCGAVLDPVIPAVHTAPGTGLILTLGRPGPAGLTDVDRQWAHAATTICEAAGIRLLGFYTATKDGVHRNDLSATAVAA
ncbi:hypothetical protein [Kribbella speibonae]|uniref:DUF4192 family protein n=1 Tax=Kribbella speibonae TaxID=1572660 RepID=A0A4R0ICE4_9ACTN|nr:hypothetical protein [Kribbella speibonae]TCC30049.1 hypothetical protein E0H92_39375 [Kribbella speibonae]